MKKSRPAKPYSHRRRLPKGGRARSVPERQGALVIDHLGAGGDGMGEIDGHKIAVAKALPGEHIRLSYHGGRGRVLELLSASAQRIDPPCPHFVDCGGCQTQHMASELEASWRRQSLEAIFTRAGMVDVDFLAPHQSPLHSRRRATFSAEKRGQNIDVGFNRQASHAIVPIDYCLVLNEHVLATREMMAFMVALLATDGNKRFSIQVTLLENGLDMDLLGCAEESLSLVQREALVERLTDSAVVRMTIEGQPFYQREQPIICFDGLDVVFPVGGFLQATREAERFMQAYIGTQVRPGRVLDLFAGCGTFSLPLGRHHKVHAVEIAGQAMACLADAAKFHHLSGLSVERRDIEQNPLLAKELGYYSTIILDPPRGGAAAQIREIAASKADHIIYISCNPKTFARDGKTLVDGGFTMGPVQLIDQFRFSAHIELAACFSRV